MNESTTAMPMAEMPVQYPCAPKGEVQRRGRFFNSGNAFNIKLPAVAARSFKEQAEAALQGRDSATLLCDQSRTMAASMAATTPLMLARYQRFAMDTSVALDWPASGLLVYVIEGAGECTCAAECWDWADGDVMLLPGAGRVMLHAGKRGALLWVVGNDPLLAFEGLLPDGERLSAPVHYAAEEIDRQLTLLESLGSDAVTSGAAVIFSTASLEAQRNVMPSLTLSLNTLQPGCHQRAHRHNSAAITLILQGEGCYSMVDGERCDWTPWTTMVTPPGAAHSHHNEGDAKALFLIVQDGGLHYHARTMGFRFLE